MSRAEDLIRQSPVEEASPNGLAEPLAALLEQVHRRSTRERVTRVLPPVEWEWHGLIAREQLAYLHGTGGLSKSLLAQALAVTHSRGGFLLDRPVRQGRTLYIDAENDDGIVDDRLRRLGLSADSDALDYHRVDPGLLAAAGGRLDTLLGHLIAESRATLTFLDSWAALWGKDEIDHEAVQEFFNTLNRVRVAAGSAILLLGHDNRKGDYRGLSVVHNSVQSRLHVKPTLAADDDDGPATEITLWHRKQRQAALAVKTPFRVDWQPRRVSITSTIARAGVLEQVVTDIHRAGGEIVPTRELLERYDLGKNWISQRADMLHSCGCERDDETDPRRSLGWRVSPEGSVNHAGLRGSPNDTPTLEGSVNHAGLRGSPKRPPTGESETPRREGSE